MRGPERTWWSRFAAIAVVGLLVFVPSQVGRIDRLGNALARQEAIQGELGDLVAGEQLPRPVAVPNRRPIPLLALWLELAPGDLVDAQEDGLPLRGSYLVPATPAVARDYILDRRDRDRRIAQPPPDFRLAKQNSAWRLYEWRLPFRPKAITIRAVEPSHPFPDHPCRPASRGCHGAGSASR